MLSIAKVITSILQVVLLGVAPMLKLDESTSVQVHEKSHWIQMRCSKQNDILDKFMSFYVQIYYPWSGRCWFHVSCAHEF